MTQEMPPERAVAASRFPERLWGLLACPECAGGLAPTPEGARCPACRLDYPLTESGQLDLRLRRPKPCRLEVTLEDGSLPEPPPFGRLEADPSPALDLTRLAGPCHLPADLRSHFPRAIRTGAPALDLGCGAQVHQEVCELAGFDYVGLDYTTPEAMLLGDAQALPFHDAVFELVLSVAVLEHVPYPLLMSREAHRVLAPGGMLLGTVAFLEPFHQRSFYHHSPLGTLTTLRHAGFQVRRIAPTGGWSGLEAQANMGLFPNSPRWLSRALVSPLLGLHRLWWRAGRLLDPSAGEEKRRLKNSGAFIFLATKDR